MQNKVLKIYLNIFGFIVFLTSALFVYGIIDKLELPSGVISIIVNYGYLIIHILSFGAMLHYSDELLINKK